MAKTEIRLSSGTVVTVDGAPNEVARIIHLIEDAQNAPTEGAEVMPKTVKKRAGSSKEHIQDLIEDGYFDEARLIRDVSRVLEERGYSYPTTSLSGPLLEFVRTKKLRRTRVDSNWMYSRGDERTAE